MANRVHFSYFDCQVSLARNALVEALSIVEGLQPAKILRACEFPYISPSHVRLLLSKNRLYSHGITYVSGQKDLVLPFTSTM